MRRLVFLFPVLLCQCASLEKSVGLGAAVGAASGVAAAQASGYNAKGNLVLGLSGAAIGGLIGVLFHKENLIDKPAESTGVSIGGAPPLRSAEKDVIWIPDKIVGDKFEERHRVWTIKKPAHWELYPEERDKQPITEYGDSDE